MKSSWKCITKWAATTPLTARPPLPPVAGETSAETGLGAEVDSASWPPWREDQDGGLFDLD